MSAEDGSLPLLFYGNSYHYPDIYRSTGSVGSSSERRQDLRAYD